MGSRDRPKKWAAEKWVALNCCRIRESGNPDRNGRKIESRKQFWEEIWEEIGDESKKWELEISQKS